MMKFLVCLLALGQVVLGKVITNEAALKPCHRSDPEINTCLQEQVQRMLVHLKNGVAQYNMEPLDPLNLEYLTAEGDLENFKIKLVMTNAKLAGHSNTTVQRIKFDPESLSGEISYSIPNMRFTCDYFATGRLFVLPLESSAHFDGNFTKMEQSISFRLKLVERKGIQYYSVDKLSLKMRFGDSHIKLVSINPAQQPQVNLIQEFYNENVQLIKELVSPVSNEQGGYFYKRMLESYLRRIPADELLPY